MTNYTNCPGCSKKVTVKTMNTAYKGVTGARCCPKCGAVFGTVYKGESYKLVKPWMGDGSFDNAFYYDLEVLGSDGITRRHGWADKDSLLVIQTG